MPQIFHRSTNTISRVTIFGAVFLVAALGWAVNEINRSPYVTQERVARQQPVPFSHRHHVSDDGIDCRYCHTSVETSAFAGIPPTKTCMNCHRELFADAPMLAPVRESFRTGEPLAWTRVYDLPGFVYFDHSIHVAKGIGCTTCHGPIGEMALTWQAVTLQMEWCVDCHRNPEKYVRPLDQVFSATWAPPADQLDAGAKLVKEYGIHTRTSCSTCHR